MGFHPKLMRQLHPGYTARSDLAPKPDPSQPHSHGHNHLAFMAVNVLVSLLLLANLLWGGFFDLRPLIGASSFKAATEHDVAAVPPQTLTLVTQEERLPQLYERARSAVVKIIVTLHGQVELNQLEPHGDCVGSGVIVDRQGHIVTDYHVIAGATDVVVQLASGRLVRAEVVGRDPSTDLAVLGIDVPAKELAKAIHRQPELSTYPDF
jgi:S1-C subfamily serine protease